MDPTEKNIPGAQPSDSADLRGLNHRIKSGAGWFYWIGAFTAIDTIMVYAQAKFYFGLGLAVVVVRNDTIRQAGASKLISQILINLALAAFIAAFGYFAGKRHGWAFIVGMILLGLDTVLTGLLEMWLNLVLHVWGMISIFLAYRACRATRSG